MFESMADAITLARRVFKKNFQLAELQPFARDLQTRRAQRDAVSFTSTARASRMDHEVIDTEQQRSLNFFTKRSTRLLQHHVVGSGEIDEVVAVNEDRRDLCLSPRLSKQEDIFDCQRLRHPPARIAREELHRVATRVFRNDQRIVNSSFNRSVKPNLRHKKSFTQRHKDITKSQRVSLCLCVFLCAFV
jgi:hypothetical protein